MDKMIPWVNKLIELVEPHELLYNQKHIEYNFNKAEKIAYELILKKLDSQNLTGAVYQK